MQLTAKDMDDAAAFLARHPSGEVNISQGAEQVFVRLDAATGNLRILSETERNELRRVAKN